MIDSDDTGLLRSVADTFREQANQETTDRSMKDEPEGTRRVILSATLALRLAERFEVIANHIDAIILKPGHHAGVVMVPDLGSNVGL